MRVFITGATGFIGGQVAQLLRGRGDEVVALARSSARATALIGLGCQVIEGDMNDRVIIDRGMEGCDTVIHLAARYEVGIRPSECPKLEDANIGGTRRVINAAIEANVQRIVYVSTVNVFGDTHRQVVDETYERNESGGFLSCYDSSKYKAHMLAESRIKDGAPIVIVQPGSVYGPNDHFEIGREILLAALGRLKFLVLADVGLNWVHVDDVADGIVRALDNGRIGESYLLGGDNLLLRDVLTKAAQLGGKKPPSTEIPTSLLKLISPIGHLIAPRLGYPPNLKELIRAANKVTYWATSEKAKTELGFSPRSIDQGLRDTLTAEDIPLAN